MNDRSLLLAEVIDGVERRLACGVKSDSGPGLAIMVTGAGQRIGLDAGDIEFLSRAAPLALPIVQAPEPVVQPLDIDGETEDQAARPDPAPQPPRAGARWLEEDDRALVDGWAAGRSVSELATSLKRSESAIAARLLNRGLAELKPTARV